MTTPRDYSQKSHRFNGAVVDFHGLQCWISVDYKTSFEARYGRWHGKLRWTKKISFSNCVKIFYELFRALTWLERH